LNTGFEGFAKQYPNLIVKKTQEAVRKQEDGSNVIGKATDINRSKFSKKQGITGKITEPTITPADNLQGINI